MHSYSNAHEKETQIQIDNKYINKYELIGDRNKELELGTIWNELEFEELVT